MRIIRGKWRGASLIAPKGDAIRPTSDRAREGVFNILSHRPGLPSLESARVLDGFCGSGAFALECLSRGAGSALAIDHAEDSLSLARRNAAKLGAPLEVLRADMTRLPPCRGEPFSFLYLDPPYGKGLMVPALGSLRAQGWIADDALVLAEQDGREPAITAEGFDVIDERRYGRIRTTFLRPV